MEQIAPCPFCGAAVKIDNGLETGSFHYVEISCGHPVEDGPDGFDAGSLEVSVRADSVELAVAAWNCRAPSQKAREEQEVNRAMMAERTSMIATHREQLERQQARIGLLENELDAANSQLSDYGRRVKDHNADAGKMVVTDEMVERFGQAFYDTYWISSDDDKAQVRAALTAALEHAHDQA